MAQEWLDAGIIASSHDVYDIARRLLFNSYQDRTSARAITGLTGNPIPWAGNLDSNKDLR
ncbi:MAG: hypothetical protein R3E31_25695 [Chloroflexota bacterium]